MQTRFQRKSKEPGYEIATEVLPPHDRLGIRAVSAASGALRLTIWSAVAQAIQLDVFDVSGRKLVGAITMVPYGTSELNVPFARHAMSGISFVRLRAGGSEVVVKAPITK